MGRPEIIKLFDFREGRRDTMILSNTMLERILNAALEGGADFAEVFCEEARHSIVQGGPGGVDSSSVGLESGVGIRVFSGLRCFYAHSNDCREERDPYSKNIAYTPLVCQLVSKIVPLARGIVAASLWQFFLLNEL